jgi:hypothetical protein
MLLLLLRAVVAAAAAAACCCLMLLLHEKRLGQAVTKAEASDRHGRRLDGGGGSLP